MAYRSRERGAPCSPLLPGPGANEGAETPAAPRANKPAALRLRPPDRLPALDEKAEFYAPKVSLQLDVAFQDLTYSVKTSLFRGERKEIVRGVSGAFRAGHVTALLGPSGAGKSTLLDILAGYTGASSGALLVNGVPRDERTFRRQSCYIMQNDILQPLLTVKEAMADAANLKLGTHIPQEKKRARVDEIMRAMGLQVCEDTRTSELSGGQRKRLSIALELVSNPPIMFFDEPTSGLDSSTSKQCMSLLRQLARGGRTIVLVLHQPSAPLLAMVDHLYALADGQCIFQGTVPRLLPHLTELGLQCPTYHNPADFLLEVCTGEYGPHNTVLVEKCQNGKSEIIVDVCQEQTQMNMINQIDSLMLSGLMTPVVAPNLSPLTPFEPPVKYKSPLKVSLTEKPKMIDFEGPPSSTVKLKHKETRYPTPFTTQVGVLFLRSFKVVFRSRVLTLMRLAIHVTVALLMGVIYYDIGNDAKFMRDNYNFMFFSVIFLMFTAFNAITLTFPLEIPIVRREHFNRWYSTSAYYAASILAGLPSQLVCSLVYALIAYYMTGQPYHPLRAMRFILALSLVSITAQAVGMLNGAIFNVQSGVIFGPLSIMPYTMFSGFFIRHSEAPFYLRWLFDISFIKHALDGVAVSILGYGREKLPCSAIYCHYKHPSRFLNDLQLEVDYGFAMGIICAVFGVYIVATYILLKYRLTHTKR